MNPVDRLDTPPGYVEYPRDPKSMPLDDIGRFELAARGTVRLNWVLTFAIISLVTDARPYWPVVAFRIACVLGAVLFLKLGLSKIFHARGWPDGYAIALAVVPGVLGLVNIYTNRLLLSSPAGLIAIAAFFGSLIFGYSAAKSLFRKVGVHTRCCPNSRVIARVVADLRRKEELRRNPRPAESLDVKGEQYEMVSDLLGGSLAKLDALGAPRASPGERLQRRRSRGG